MFQFCFMQLTNQRTFIFGAPQSQFQFFDFIFDFRVILTQYSE